MISQYAVEKWMSRNLKDLAKAKLYSDKELDARIAAVPGGPPKFFRPPRKHNKVAFLLGAYFPGIYFALDMGTGKSGSALDVFAYRKKQKEARRALILVPFGANISEWVDEVAAHRPDCSITTLDVGTEENSKRLHGTDDLVVGTYQGFLRLVTSQVEGGRELEDGTRERGHLVLDMKKLEKVARSIDMLIMDEPQVLLRNHDSLIVRALWQVRKRIGFAYALSGTPYNDPEDLWSQFLLVDKGETLGWTLGMYRAAFFTPKKRYFGRGFDFKFRKELTEKLNRMLSHRMIRYAEEECVGLPPKVGGMFSETGPKLIQVTFPEETWAYYEKLVGDLQEARGNFTLVNNAFIRMRQLSAGYLGVLDPEGEKITVRFKDNPKIDALLDLLKRIPEDRKVIVFCVLRATGALILEALKKAKVRAVRLAGGMAKGARERVKREFRKGKARVLVASEAAAYGCNFQVASVEVFFESPTPPITRRQMEKRAHRGGQTRTVHIYDLVVKNSIDMKIIRALLKGGDLFEELVNGRGRRVVRVRLKKRREEE